MTDATLLTEAREAQDFFDENLPGCTHTIDPRFPKRCGECEGCKGAAALVAIADALDALEQAQRDAPIVQAARVLLESNGVKAEHWAALKDAFAALAERGGEERT